MHHKLRYAGFVVVFQHPVHAGDAFCVADFFIPRKGLLIEVDGGYHNCPDQQKKDRNKDALYESLGYNVLRIRNEDVDTFDTNSIHTNFRRRQNFSWVEPVIPSDEKKKRIKQYHKGQKTFKKNSY